MTPYRGMRDVNSAGLCFKTAFSDALISQCLSLCDVQQVMRTGVMPVPKIVSPFATTYAGVSDICTYAGLTNQKEYLYIDAARDYLDGIALTSRSMAYTAFLYYILDNFVCYYESAKGGYLTKEIVCGNVDLINYFVTTPLTPTQYKDFESYLSPTEDDVKAGVLRFIKLKFTDTGEVVAPKRRPSVTYPIKGSTILQPMCFTKILTNSIRALAEQGVVEFSLLRDNNVPREMVCSLNKPILLKIFNDPIYVTSTINSSTVVVDRGYMKLPDIDSSVYEDECGIRAVSYARLNSIKYFAIDPNQDVREQMAKRGYPLLCTHVALNEVLEHFKQYVDKMGSRLDFVSMLYQDITGTPAQFVNADMGKAQLVYWAESQSTLTTSFVRKLHRYMIEHPMFFQGYSGKPSSALEKALNLGDFRQMGIEPKKAN